MIISVFLKCLIVSGWVSILLHNHFNLVYGEWVAIVFGFSFLYTGIRCFVLPKFVEGLKNPFSKPAEFKFELTEEDENLRDGALSNKRFVNMTWIKVNEKILRLRGKREATKRMKYLGVPASIISQFEPTKNIVAYDCKTKKYTLVNVNPKLEYARRCLEDVYGIIYMEVFKDEKTVFLLNIHSLLNIWKYERIEYKNFRSMGYGEIEAIKIEKGCERKTENIYIV